MPNNVMEVLQVIVGELKQMARSETVIGQPVTAGDRTIIPLTRISVGFGAGGGEDEHPEKGARFGGGGGGGAVIEPVGFLILDHDKVSILTARDRTTFDKIIDATPDVLAAIKDFAKKTPDAKSGQST
ncbi:MAG: sporulation protein [candidate division Zixibacteria bacterium]|nr:sporulation protein [candidate division Zixibacteria bacterium]